MAAETESPQPPTAISLFSGCGGLDVGAERAGARVSWATDRMPEAAGAMATLLPETTFHLDDIRRIPYFPDAEIVLGGYPCQPFSMGGNRSPTADDRSLLFQEFARAVEHVGPSFFVAENVQGLRSLGAQKWLNAQIARFRELGRHGYFVTVGVLDAADFGVPQRRKRLFLVGVRKDLRSVYCFPTATHSKTGEGAGLKRWTSHGDALEQASLPDWPSEEFYDRPGDPDGGFSWWYMSRQRRAPWDQPARTVVANERQVGLHPASCTMELEWSRLADGSKQRWRFTGEHEHTAGHPGRLALPQPRRLSWRECAVLQTFPSTFEPTGSRKQKYEQIGNAVPPVLAEAVIRPLVDGTGLRPVNRLTDPERVLHGLHPRGRAGSRQV